MVKTAVAGIVEEWRRDDLGLGNGGGRRPQRRWLKVKMVSAAVEGEAGVGSGEVLVCGFRRLVGRRCRWVSLGLFFFFFFFFGFVSMGSVIKGGHGWWSPAWVASLASLLAWG